MAGGRRRRRGRRPRPRCLAGLGRSRHAAPFTSGGKPDAAGFDREVGGLIRQAARTGRPVRAFGEMVALLWDAGLVTAAVELGVMWNDLGRQQSFDLLCGYPAASVTGEDAAGALAEVCRLHAAVITGGSAGPAQLGAAGGQIRASTASLNAPRAVRRFVVAALQDCGACHLADDAAIVVAELAASAVLHARSGFTVTLAVQPQWSGSASAMTTRCLRPTPARPCRPRRRTDWERWRHWPLDGGADPAGKGNEVWAELPR